MQTFFDAICLGLISRGGRSPIEARVPYCREHLRWNQSNLASEQDLRIALTKVRGGKVPFPDGY